MAETIADAYINLIPSAEGLSDGIKKAIDEGSSAGTKSSLVGLSNLTSGFAMGVGQAAFSAVSAVVSTVGDFVGDAVGAIVSSTSELASVGDTIDKESQKLGISAKAYQEWDAVLQHSGTSVDSFKSAVRTLSKELVSAQEVSNNVAQAELELEEQLESGKISFEEYNTLYDELYNGAYESIGALSQLGFSMMEIEEMSQDSDLALEKVITALQAMPEGAERTALAQEILGRSAMELGPLLNTTAEETQAMKDKVNELGGVLSDEAVKNSAQFQDNLQDLQTAMTGIKRNIVSDLLPGLNDLMDGFTKLLTGSADADKVLDEGIEKFLQGLYSAGEKILNIVTELFPRIIEGITNHFPELVNGLVELLSSLVPALLDAIANTIIPSLLEALPPLLEMLIEVVPPLFFSLVDALLNMLPIIVELAFTLITTLANGLAEAIPELIPTIIDVLLLIFDVVMDNLSVILDAAEKIIDALIAGIIDNLPEISIAVTKIMWQMVATFISLLPQIVEVAFQIVFTLISSMISTLLEFLSGDFWQDAISAIVTSFTDIDWEGIGTKCIEGIANGFMKAVDKVKNAAINVKDSIKQIFTEGFKIQSPSKVFEQYGKFIDEGLAIGMRSGESVTASEELAQNINNDFKGSLSAPRYKSESNMDGQRMLELLSEQNDLLWQILNKNYGRSDNELFQSIQRSAKDYSRKTGNYAFGG